MWVVNVSKFHTSQQSHDVKTWDISVIILWRSWEPPQRPPGTTRDHRSVLHRDAVSRQALQTSDVPTWPNQGECLTWKIALIRDWNTDWNSIVIVTYNLCGYPYSSGWKSGNCCMEFWERGTVLKHTQHRELWSLVHPTSYIRISCKDCKRVDVVGHRDLSFSATDKRSCNATICTIWFTNKSQWKQKSDKKAVLTGF